MLNRSKQSAFDLLDFQIIQNLAGNVRIDAAKIARAIDANERTVRKRIKRLMELDAFRLAPVLNPKVFDYITTANILLKIEPEQEETVLQTLLEMQAVAYLAYGQGEQEFLVQVHFKDYADLRQFARQHLPEMPGVMVLHVRLVPGTLQTSEKWRPALEDFRVERPKLNGKNGP